MPRTDRASRIIPASVERVYAALIDPEALTAWLPPGDMTGAIDYFAAALLPVPAPRGRLRAATK
jgi:uncharacterized protein YndB with AHSA1/START domain